MNGLQCSGKFNLVAGRKVQFSKPLMDFKDVLEKCGQFHEPLPPLLLPSRVAGSHSAHIPRDGNCALKHYRNASHGRIT
jgi:hypothetical protein